MNGALAYVVAGRVTKSPVSEGLSVCDAGCGTPDNRYRPSRYAKIQWLEDFFQHPNWTTDIGLTEVIIISVTRIPYVTNSSS